ncbi:MAG: hypothetical protein WBA97_38295 [Actinophytocola sp.]
MFPDEPAIAEAGWASQESSDLLAVLGPRLVGVPANRIPALPQAAGRPSVLRVASRGRRRTRCPRGPPAPPARGRQHPPRPQPAAHGRAG